MTAFIVSGSDLHAAAAWASRVTPAKPTAPVLSGLLLDAGDDLAVSGYDFETHATAIVPATATVPGRMLLSARLLTAIAKTVARQVAVSLNDAAGAIQVRCGGAEWTMPALPVADYPQLPNLGDPAGAVRADELRQALGRVLPALSRDSNALAVLTAVKLLSDGNQLTLVGTDRFRLAAATIGWEPTAPEQTVDALVTGALLDTAVRAATGGSDLVLLHNDERGFGLATDTFVITGRKIAEQYPNWQRVAAQPGEHHALVDVDELAHATEQALIAADDNPQVLLAFNSDGVQVSAVGADRRARSTAAADLVGEPIIVKVNAAFLRDALTLHGCDKVTIHFGATPTKPLLVLGDDDNYRHTLVPVRLTEQERGGS